MGSIIIDILMILSDGLTFTNRKQSKQKRNCELQKDYQNDHEQKKEKK